MMKKAITAVIAALMMLPSAGLTSAADEAALSFGDPNGDGNIDAKDASFILAAYSRLSTGEEGVLTAAENTAADVKTDGNVDAKDASAILAYYAYLSTGGTLDLTDYLLYGDEPASTTITTSVTTTATETTSQGTVTTIPYNQRTYTKYDLTSDDPKISRCAMDQLSTELAKELFQGYVGYRSLNGGDEAISIIIALNSDQNINGEMIGHYHIGYSNEEFNDSCDLLDLARYQYEYESSVDFSKYVLDEELAEFIENISEKYKKYNEGNKEPLREEINNYFSKKIEDIDDYVKYYFMCNTKNSAGIDTPELDYARQLYFDEVLSPLYSEFGANAHRIYLR